jgi:hypothetical protein
MGYSFPVYVLAQVPHPQKKYKSRLEEMSRLVENCSWLAKNRRTSITSLPHTRRTADVGKHTARIAELFLESLLILQIVLKNCILYIIKNRFNYSTRIWK